MGLLGLPVWSNAMWAGSSLVHQLRELIGSIVTQVRVRFCVAALGGSRQEFELSCITSTYGE